MRQLCVTLDFVRAKHTVSRRRFWLCHRTGPGAVDSGPMVVWPALAATAAVLLLCLPRAALTLDNGVSLTPDMGW